MKLELHKFFSEKRRYESNPWVKFLYSTTITAGIIGPLTNGPQILKIFVGRNATGVSLLSWSLFALFDIPFIIWSIVQRDVPVFVTYSLWFVSNFLVVIGVLMYG